MREYAAGVCVYTGTTTRNHPSISPLSLPPGPSADASYAYMREYTSPRKRSREKHRALTRVDTFVHGRSGAG